MALIKGLCQVFRREKVGIVVVISRFFCNFAAVMQNYGTILVIDDNEAILTALKYCLTEAFERVLTMTSPESVITLLEQEEVNIILLDMNFTLGVNSGQDGLLWLQAIRKHHPEIPVVLITAYADVSLAVRGLKRGAADFITKPWDNDELLRKLKDVLDANDDMATLDELEADHIRRAIDRCHGNLSKAADLLGITRQTLYNKMKKLQ
jgi:DNA-binding NtrC family response regulator